MDSMEESPPANGCGSLLLEVVVVVDCGVSTSGVLPNP